MLSTLYGLPRYLVSNYLYRHPGFNSFPTYMHYRAVIRVMLYCDLNSVTFIGQ
ncbi:hypothetical protein [Deminuibacter soli]|uniref:hypothetical protein n=1 Tax=Deminuibacter soli TaxID=2291815 RepID=UPI0013148593|nr:hypothetical protein [Deminuibacter soli]